MKPNFQTDLKAGQAGEKALLKLWPELTLLSGKGADATLPDGELVEIKADRYDHAKTENFFIEFLGDVDRNKEGGPWKAEKDGCKYFVYYFSNPGIAYVFENDDLLQQVSDYILTHNPKLVEIQNKRWLTVGYKIPRVSLVPLRVLHSKAIK